ncbi:hypothetical protein PC123_g20305 [Phytophthora cactorum]|nr:hypothetical protein PC123_g20305 [Phytophthora cactorum]
MTVGLVPAGWDLEVPVTSVDKEPLGESIRHDQGPVAHFQIGTMEQKSTKSVRVAIIGGGAAGISTFEYQKQQWRS